MSDWITVAEDSELSDGERKALTIHKQPILLFKIEGQYYAIQNLCTHEALPLTEGTLEGDTIICPFHGASFCIKTGAVTAPPAFSDLETYPVRVNNQMVQVQL